jgi:hypothetical protein
MSGFDKMAEKYEKKVSFQGMLFEMIEAVLEAGLPLEEQDPAPAGSEKLQNLQGDLFLRASSQAFLEITQFKSQM